MSGFCHRAFQDADEDEDEKVNDDHEDEKEMQAAKK
jgi:hypothetical protein